MRLPITIGALLLLGTLPASILAQDSILHYTKGNISGRVFEVEEILVRPSCQCIGECCCESNSADSYATHRFLSTDALLTANSRVSLIRRGNYAMEPVLNGMASDRVNLTIDGMKIFGACTDKMDPVTSYVEPNNMKSITVQHGASGSMYGPSMGGSVNMETSGAQLNAANRLSGELGAGFQSAASGANGLMSLNYGRKRWAVRVNGLYRRAENYRAGGGATVNFSQFEKWNGALSAKFMATERDMLRFDLIMDEAYNVGYPALPMDVLHAKARIYGLTYTHFPVAEWFEQLETKLYANEVAHSMDDTRRPNVVMHMDMPGSTRTYGGYMDGRLRFGKHAAVIRLDGFHSNARAEMTMYPVNEAPMFMLTWPDVDRLNLGLFLQDHIRFNERRSLGINARVEYTGSAIMDEFGVRQASIFHQNADIPDHRLLKNASISYQEKLKAGPTLFATIGYAERAPSITEQYGFYIFNAYDGFDHVGNRDVLTEKALQADAGVRWERKKFTVNVSGFYYYMMDYILAAMDSSMDAMTIGANGVKVTENLPSAMMAGANMELNCRPWKFLHFGSTLSYTYGSAKDGAPLPLVPPLRTMVTARYIYGKGWLQLECEMNAPQNRTSPAFGERTTPAYGLLNLRAGHEFRIGAYGLSLSGGVENLLDTHYRNHLDWGGIPRPGINGYLNVSFSF
jgi:iron complex outermembrane recepter protein